jgi:hypothetical protein
MWHVQVTTVAVEMQKKHFVFFSHYLINSKKCIEDERFVLIFSMTLSKTSIIQRYLRDIINVHRPPSNQYYFQILKKFEFS